jgi:predicted TIM-barrel fold metal-dependent hydrolase
MLMSLPGSAQVVPRTAAVPPPAVDYHQHLISPTLAALVAEPTFPAIDAARLIAQLDAAGIQRAVVHSTAYIFTQPSRISPGAYERVKADNDWTSAQVARYPDRLVAFCAVNPLEDWAVEEVARCAKDPNLRRGVKMHFGNAVLDYRNAAHVEAARRVFEAANEHGMALAVHMRTSISQQVPYGRDQAMVFLNELLTAAPDVPVQIAHLGGTGSYFDDPPVEPALLVFVEAIRAGDPRMKHVWFDVTGMANAEATAEQKAHLAGRIRQLGVERVLYGSDAPTPENPPASGWETFRTLPLTDAEFRTIATNLAPYVR